MDKKEPELGLSRIQEMIDILERDGEVSTEDLAAEMGLQKNRIYQLASYINIKHAEDPENYPHIYRSEGVGYTLANHIENCVYEAGMRMKRAFGTMVRGVPAFYRAKQLRAAEFKAMSMTFNPSGEMLNKMIVNYHKGSKKKQTQLT